MSRQPIMSQDVPIAVQIVREPITLKNLLPNYSYQFQSIEIPEEARKMYEDLIEFLKVNEELAVPDSTIISDESYIKGFQKSLALTRLWIDSVYLSDGSKSSFSNIK